MLTPEAGDWKDKAEQNVHFWCAGEDKLHPQKEVSDGKKQKKKQAADLVINRHEPHKQ